MKQNELFAENPREKYKSLNPNDIVFTPENIAKHIIEWANHSGTCLDPCMGEGAFYNNLPEPKHWCEITKGRDYYDYNEKVDWIIINPPYSQFDKFLDHSFKLADNIVLLVPIAKVFKSWGTIMKIKQYGGIVKMLFMPASMCGFPFGFSVMAVHIQKNYKKQTQIQYIN